jgi:hypothetical protein
MRWNNTANTKFVTLAKARQKEVYGRIVEIKSSTDTGCESATSKRDAVQLGIYEGIARSTRGKTGSPGGVGRGCRNLRDLGERESGEIGRQKDEDELAEVLVQPIVSVRIPYLKSGVI